MPSAILDSLSIVFLAISDQYKTLFFYKMAAQPFWMSEIHWNFYFSLNQLHCWSIGHFGCLKITFDGISGHFRSIRIFSFFQIFDKMAAGGHFGCPKITFDCIFGYFRSIRNFFLCWFFFDKVVAGGHFGWDDNVNYRTRPRYLDE